MKEQLEMNRLTFMLLLDHKDIINKLSIELVEANIRGIELVLENEEKLNRLKNGE